MKLTVGFYCGLARRLSKETEAEVEVHEGATLRDVCAALAKKFPAFLGQLIVPGTHDLVEPHFFNVNGSRAANLDVTVQEGDRILLMAITAGG
ncbi:MAG: MoaD/ThiS family protein [Chloroflexi bacterium]|nr:MoaD/ThiS family protein [Chloroflexota bacterium]